MLLVLISILFLWTIQLGLFERSYIDAAVSEMENRVQPIIEDIDEYGLEEAVSYISAAVHGKVFLLDRNGTLLYAYGVGLPAVLDEVDTDMMKYFGDNLGKVLDGGKYKELIRDAQNDLKLANGMPISFGGSTYALFSFSYMSEISAMQSVNLRQLLVLSAALIVSAGFLAFLLARHLVRPLKIIEKTVNRMTEGDLTAKPGLKRSDELGQLSDSVEKLGVSLQRVDVLRKEVIANVSHELKAPLSVIIGYSEMVKRRKKANGAHGPHHSGSGAPEPNGQRYFGLFPVPVWIHRPEKKRNRSARSYQTGGRIRAQGGFPLSYYAPVRRHWERYHLIS